MTQTFNDFSWESLENRRGPAVILPHAYQTVYVCVCFNSFARREAETCRHAQFPGKPVPHLRKLLLPMRRQRLELTARFLEESTLLGVQHLGWFLRSFLIRHYLVKCDAGSRLSIFVNIIWAATWQNRQCGCAPSEDSDQPGHPPSLTRVFAFRMKKAWSLSYPLSYPLSTHFVGFVISRLNFKECCIIKLFWFQPDQNVCIPYDECLKL